jgi:hypothetical protein
MRNVTKYGIVMAVFMAGWPAQAWGPITHAYIAAQVLPNAPPQALFGAMAADMNGFSFGRDKLLAGHLKRLTHAEASRLAPSPFQLGMLTHNSAWGADRYAHAYHYAPEEKLYAHRIFEQLSQETGISMNDAEDVIEMTMDYVICRDLGAPFIQRIAEAADAAGPCEEQAVVDAFTEPLMQTTPEFSREHIVEMIRAMFQCDKCFLKQLTQVMSFPDESLRRLGRLIIPVSAGTEMAKTDHCLQRAIELCADWRVHLDEIAHEIGDKMRSLHLIAE